MRLLDPRRLAPRVRIDGLCAVVSERELRHAALLDLSALGLRLERPFDPRTARRFVQLEIELPETDEIVWARGEVTFARLTPMGGQHPDGQPRLWCRAGLRFDRLTRRDRSLLRDYVVDARQRRRGRPRASTQNLWQRRRRLEPRTGAQFTGVNEHRKRRLDEACGAIHSFERPL